MGFSPKTSVIYEDMRLRQPQQSHFAVFCIQAVRLLSTSPELGRTMKTCSHSSPDASDKLWAIVQRSFAVESCMPFFTIVLHIHHLGCISEY